jgi:hypothetical protein
MFRTSFVTPSRPKQYPRPVLETLEDRLVPSTVAGSYPDGTWRYDTTVGWSHISTLKATILDVDDAGDVYGKYANSMASDGLWRWDAATMSWAKLSSLTVSDFQVTAGGVLYGNFGSVGTWRWSPTSGWAMLSANHPSLFAVSDSDAFFGRFDSAGSVGTWRWTPTTGWSLLTTNRPDQLRTDSAGEMVGVFSAFIPAGQQGTWRWNPTSGWARLDSVVASHLAVSSNGAIYEDRGSGGLWYTKPGAMSPTQIGTASENVFEMVALPDGSVVLDRQLGGAGAFNAWYWNPSLQGIGFVQIIAGTDTLTIDSYVVGKDGDVFTMEFAGTGAAGTGYWSLSSAYHLIGTEFPNPLASQR